MAARRAAARYGEASLPVVIVAGERYGTGSSRDWAAKGVQLLGARAVLANSFERIHRANLVCMGVLPLRMPEDWRPEQLSLSPGDVVAIEWDLQTLSPRCQVRVELRRADGSRAATGVATALLETAREVAMIREGGIIPMILGRALAGKDEGLAAA